jgi:small subunit ribosomal protein S4
MARDTSPIVKQSRREGYALHPKAHKIMARKSGIPGEHAHGRQGKPSLYLTQLREKQKVRRTVRSSRKAIFTTHERSNA